MNLSHRLPSHETHPTCSPNIPSLPMTTRPGNRCDTHWPWWWNCIQFMMIQNARDVLCLYGKHMCFFIVFWCEFGDERIELKLKRVPFWHLFWMKQRPFFGTLNVGLLPDLCDKFSFQTKNLTSCKTSCTPLSNQVAVHNQFGPPQVDNQQNLHTSKTNPVIWKILELEIAPRLLWK